MQDAGPHSGSCGSRSTEPTHAANSVNLGREGKGYRPYPATVRNIGALARARPMRRLALTMADASPPRKETRLRLCPHCLSVDVGALGRVAADSTGVRSEYRCRTCSTDFLLLFDTRRIGAPDHRATD